ncbi:MAG: hypothetical protein ACYDC3_10815, partial [Candidatus Binataceae bacterium]
MRRARGVVKHSGSAANSPVADGAGSEVEGLFVRAWQAAIVRMKAALDAAPGTGWSATADSLIDQVGAAEQAFVAGIDSLLQSTP